VSISLAGLARFGCDLSATVGRIPNFGQTSQSRIRPLRQGEKRGPGATRRKRMAWHCARHQAAFINQSGSLGRIHGLDPPPAAIAGQDLPVRGIRRAKSPRRTTIREWAGLHFEGVALCGALATPEGGRRAGSRNRPITASYIRLSDKLLLGRFGRTLP
jgi:hypothetical protein